jgi:hypothetical protein
MSCGGDPEPPATPASTIKNTPTQPLKKRFELVAPQVSGVTFSNAIKEDYNHNILTFEYLYNGGGVAIGDLNNDGLPDIYFSGTFVSNKLYLNKGNLKFEDITDQAGVAAHDGFKTGVTMADVNNDGWLDIFVCRTSKSDDGKKDNLLFINNKNLTFTESTKQFGLNDNSNTNHANFFDYDNDGDLDLYLLNHRLGFQDAVKMDLQSNPDGSISRIKTPKTPFESDRLYKNNNGKFTNVTKAAGVENSSFGLSATVADLNQDGYLDIYVANDYIEPDYVYINNRNGTFTDKYDSYIRHSSQNSMGCDIADFNNDGLLDIMVMDMIAEDPIRYKQLMNVMRKDRYNALLQYGYGRQTGRNVLQINNGNNTYSEIGQLSGVSNTDWSWGALFADFDNDGWKDIYIGNGYRRDVTDLDYMSYTRDSIEKSGGITKRRFPDINTYLDLIPSKKMVNYAYKNNRDLTFTNATQDWGITQASFSNGTAYADLDADGDLDLIVNNIDDPAFIYKNLTTNSNYLQINLLGSNKNTQATGTKVKIYLGNDIQFLEKTANRGFFSGSDPLLHFGLGNYSTVDKIEVTWMDGKTHVIENVPANQRLTLKHAEANKKPISTTKSTPIFTEKNSTHNIAFTHKENAFDDFNRERLLPHKLSNLGPHISKGDVNGDGFEDFFIGGAANSSAALFVQDKNGNFQNQSNPTWEADQIYEDLGSVFFDAEGDGDLDLYVASGGNASNINSTNYQDRLYINDGAGIFSKGKLPTTNSSAACVAAFDYDRDGDLDIFVGGRTVPGKYPTAPQSLILKNDQGIFSNVTQSVAPEFEKIGMVTDLKLADLDQDGKEELIALGEWMPISIFSYDGKKFNNVTTKYGLQNTSGWWNCFALEDFDKDGDLDIIAGNLGENSRIKASKTQPIKIFANDFDGNGSLDAVMTFDYQGKQYPYAGRDHLFLQLPGIKRNFNRYNKYAKADITAILPKEKLASAQVLEAKLMSSVLLKNEGGKFSITTLLRKAQIAPSHEILTSDFNGDGNMDALLIGNDDGAETESGAYDASNGTLLLGDGKGGFNFSPNKEHGLWANMQARDAVKIKLANGKTMILIANNGGKLQAYIQESKHISL